MEMHIAEWKKLSCIQGKTKPCAELEDGYEKWYAENQKVKRWLLMSMSPESMKRYPPLKKSGVCCQRLSIMEVMNCKFSL